MSLSRFFAHIGQFLFLPQHLMGMPVKLIGLVSLSAFLGTLWAKRVDGGIKGPARTFVLILMLAGVSRGPMVGGCASGP